MCFVGTRAYPRPRRRLPTLSSVLMRTMTVGSSRQRDEWLSRDTADLYLYLNLSGVGLLDFENVRPVVDRGYEAADPEIEAWLAGRPVQPNTDDPIGHEAGPAQDSADATTAA